MFDLSSVATKAVTSKSKKSIKIPEKLQSFILAIHEGKIRITYSAWHKLCQREGLCSEASVLNSGCRFVNALPKEVQYCICRSNGGYHEAALEKWGEVAPEGFARRPVAEDAAILAVYNG